MNEGMRLSLIRSTEMMWRECAATKFIHYGEGRRLLHVHTQRIDYTSKSRYYLTRRSL